MTALNTPATPTRTTPPPSGTPDQIGAWLDRLVRLTRLPSGEAAELRDELDAHLRERVRDLMLVGHDEPDAIHKSISELGDLALLAQRYRDASRSPKRRMLMHIALFTAAAAALGISTVALQQTAPQPTNAAGTQPETDLTLTLEPTVSADGSIDITAVLSQVPKLISLYSETNGRALPVLAHNMEGKELGELFLSMGEAADARVYVYWNLFIDFGLESETTIDPMPFAEQTIDKAFLILSDTLSMRGSMQLAYRLDNGLMEIATVEFFDRRELELVGYEVAFLLDAESPLDQSIESDTLIELVTTLVEPGVWQDNGGYASASAVGNQLFINAPARVHARVAWLLAELGKDALHTRSGDALTMPDAHMVEPRTHAVRPGDTLTSIAEQTLGNPELAKEIIAANPGISAGGLEVGRVLTLPTAVQTR